MYDGWNLIRETTTTDAGNATEYYVWGLDLSGSLQGAGGIGGLLLRNTDSGSFLYVYDANGNAGQLVDAADGALAAHYEYDPFGNLLTASGPDADNNPFRFSTKYFDTETGLYYYGYRYYAPELGRWITRDPIGEQGGINLYAFVENAPVSHLDYRGLQIKKFSDITIHQLYRTGKNLAEVVLIDPQEELVWGHWWIEIGQNESYGWWPVEGTITPAVSSGFIQAEGSLNNQKSRGSNAGTSTKDPDHGTIADHVVDALVSDWGELEYGDEGSKGQSCLCLSKDNNVNAVKSCVRDFAQHYGPRYNFRWSWPSGPNCRSFIEEMLGTCCMFETRRELKEVPLPDYQ